MKVMKQLTTGSFPFTAHERYGILTVFGIKKE